jgi:hypothetical protein
MSSIGHHLASNGKAQPKRDTVKPHYSGQVGTTWSNIALKPYEVYEHLRDSREIVIRNSKK